MTDIREQIERNRESAKTCRKKNSFEAHIQQRLNQSADALESLLARVDELERFIEGEGKCHISHSELERLEAENRKLQIELTKAGNKLSELRYELRQANAEQD